VNGTCPCGPGEVSCQTACYRELAPPPGSAGEQLAWILEVVRSGASAGLTEANLVGRVVPGFEAGVLSLLQALDDAVSRISIVNVTTATETFLQVTTLADNHVTVLIDVIVEGAPSHRIDGLGAVPGDGCPPV
jgi:hypothetical protein